MWALFLTAVVILIVLKLLKVSLFWKSGNIPYEPYYRYLYRVYWILNTRGYNEFVTMASKRYGKVFGTYKGFTPTLATADLAMAKEVLIKQFNKFFKRTNDFKSGEPIWDNTLLSLERDEWKLMRNAMGLAFTSAKMRPMIAKFDVIAKRLCKKLARLAEVDGGKFEAAMFDFAKTYSLDATMAVAYGKDTSCVENPDPMLLENTKVAAKPGLATLFFYINPNLFRYFPFVNFPEKNTIDFFSGLAEHMLKEKRAKLDEVVANGTEDIMDRLLVQQRGDPRLTDELLISQSFIFVVAGLDATALAIAVTTYYLALFPEAQEKALEEIESVLGSRKEVRHDDLQHLKYLEACLYESFRFFPFKFPLDRVCDEDTVICDIPIKKGMVVEILQNEINQDPTYFSEPQDFKPERFVRSGSAQDNQLGAFMLFGEGPKHCAGKRLGTMSSLTALANLVRELKFETCTDTPTHPPEMSPGFDFAHVTTKPLTVRMVPRK